MQKHFVVIVLFVVVATLSLAKPSKSDSKRPTVQGEKLSDAQHYSDGGEHDHTYDHEAFLGKDRADQFKQLTPEESKRRLGIIVDKIDKNRDGKVDKAELTDWIKHSLKKSAYDDAKGRMELQDLDNSGDLEFDEWVNTTYSYMAAEDKQDEYFDPGRKITYRQQIKEDRKAWKAADENGDGRLDVDEYTAYLHPHDFPHMHDIVLDRHSHNMDTNKDGYISKQEYIDDVYKPDRDGAGEPDWLQTERENFNHWDLDGDGRLNRKELTRSVVPTHYDPYDSEAAHLINEVDTNEDKVLSKQEILDKQDVFVASRATEFGKQLTKHDEF